MLRRALTLVVLYLGILAVSPTATRSLAAQPARIDDAATDRKSDAQDSKRDALTLKRMFPKKSLFGPRVTRAEFSRDGRFCAFFYRPWAERRHGSDLYLMDTQTRRVSRITCVSRMAEFQSDSRKVRDDREKKAKAAGIKLETLRHEQADRLGWLASPFAGEFKGTAAGQGETLAPGDGTLKLSAALDGTLSGSLHIGLVELQVTEGTVGDDRALSATVTNAALEDDGTLEVKIEGDTLSGELIIGTPAQKLSLNLTRQETNADDGPTNPRGVIGALGERLTLGDVVLDEDADINDEKDGKPPKDKAPRYSGLSSIEWSPVGYELLVVSQGDIYRLTFDAEAFNAPLERPIETASDDEPEDSADDTEDDDADADADAPDSVDQTNDQTKEDENGSEPEEPGDKSADADKKDPAEPATPVVPYRGTLERLTRTRESERSVQYLPDGSGYTYLRGTALMRVTFGDPRMTQLDPELEDGERMSGYRLSPDQRRLVFYATKGKRFFSAGRKVTIISYRDRFAKARTITRHMPDDPFPDVYSSVYLYDLDGHEREEGTLQKVFTRRVTGPRDVLRMPEWSPDSSRICFSAFDQKTSRIKILEAGFVQEDPEEGEADTGEDHSKTADNDDPPPGDDNDDAEADDDKPDFTIENAKIVYEFLHTGGPNTPRMVQPNYLPDSRRMVFVTELSGYRQLHLLDPRYEQLSQLTEGQFEVYPIDISEDHARLFVAATAEDPNQQHIYRVDLPSGTMTKLTTREGTWDAHAVSDDGTMVAAAYSDFGAPRETYILSAAADDSDAPVTDSHLLSTHELTDVGPEYFTYENRHDQTIHGHMFKPDDWTADDKRPLLIYVYGGPLGARNMASRGSFSASSYFFARYMTEVHGWVTATIDPRGASGYGAKFEKANFEQVGKPQTEDLVDGAKWLTRHAGVDPKRRALHGWSFGGFQTQMVLYTEPKVFAVGIAGAGPTEWHNYNTWYSTGTIGASAAGKTDLKKYSLLPLAKNLESHLLLVHGVEDSNVLYQDTVRVYRELLQADKETLVELFIDPTGGHGLGGDVKTIGRYRKYEDFLLRHLGEGQAAEAAQADDDEAKAAVADDGDHDDVDDIDDIDDEDDDDEDGDDEGDDDGEDGDDEDGDDEGDDDGGGWLTGWSYSSHAGLLAHTLVV